MASIRFAARYRCDFCGKIADVEPPEGDNLYSYQGPPGWLLRLYQPDSQARLMVIVQTADHSEFSDFCDDCVALPLGTVLGMLQRRLTGDG